MNQIVTLQEAKTYLEINSDEKDAYLTALLASLTDAMEVYLGRYIIERAITGEAHFCASNEEKKLNLNCYPVKEITRVVLNGVDITAQPLGVELQSGVITRAGGWGGETFVTYKGGLADDINAVPKDIKFALCLWAKEVMSKDAFVKSETLGDYSVSFLSDANMPAAALKFVEKYRGYSL